MTEKLVSDANAKTFIAEIDKFIGRPQIESKGPQFHGVLAKPFLGRGIKSRLANLIVTIPLKIFQKSTVGYLSYRNNFDNLLLEKIDEIEHQKGEQNDGLESVLQTNTEMVTDALNKKMDQKVYEMMKLVDAIKSEVMAEINKEVSPVQGAKIETKVINEKRVKSIKKLNLGSGSHILEDYVNVDHREIKGVDLVADITEGMPFKPGSIKEIFTAHVVEHFTERKVKDILMYWYELLAEGGVLRIIVPDIDSMIKGYCNGDIEWSRLRSVILGGQDYNSDYHFNIFSGEYLTKLCRETLKSAEIKLVDEARENGEALEIEIEVKKRRERNSNAD